MKRPRGPRASRCGSCLVGVAPGPEGIERCDDCKLLSSDAAALALVVTLLEREENQARLREARAVQARRFGRPARRPRR
jgi:hypothetical protein